MTKRTNTINLLNDIKPRLYNGFKSKAECLRVIRKAGFKFTSALGAVESNPKIAKNSKLGVLSRGHNFAPAKTAGYYFKQSSNGLRKVLINTCSEASLGCEKACLHTAGNPIYLPNKVKARIARTQAFYNVRKAYLALVCFEIESHLRKAISLNMICGIRLNTTSDTPFESVYLDDGKTIFETFPQVDFMDYTKRFKAMLRFCAGNMPSNYHLTFSKSESNWDQCLEVLKAGGNVAAVFDKLPESYAGYAVIDGDESDWRPMDQKNVIVGLKAKGLARNDDSGFTIRIATQEKV